MPDSVSARDPLEELAEEFIDRYRRGEVPEVVEYTDRYPEHADTIRDLFPALLKLEQEGYIASGWGTSDNNRRARFYRLTRAGRRQVEREERAWQDATEIVARFLAAKAAQ